MTAHECMCVWTCSMAVVATRTVGQCLFLLSLVNIYQPQPRGTDTKGDLHVWLVKLSACLESPSGGTTIDLCSMEGGGGDRKRRRGLGGGRGAWRGGGKTDRQWLCMTPWLRRRAKEI